MERTLVGMAALFGVCLLTSVAGLVVLPGGWIPVFGSVAALSGIGLSITGYAITRA